MTDRVRMEEDPAISDKQLLEELQEYDSEGTDKLEKLLDEFAVKQDMKKGASSEQTSESEEEEQSEDDEPEKLLLESDEYDGMEEGPGDVQKAGPGDVQEAGPNGDEEEGPDDDEGEGPNGGVSAELRNLIGGTNETDEPDKDVEIPNNHLSRETGEKVAVIVIDDDSESTPAKYFKRSTDAVIVLSDSDSS